MLLCDKGGQNGKARFTGKAYSAAVLGSSRLFAAIRQCDDLLPAGHDLVKVQM